MPAFDVKRRPPAPSSPPPTGQQTAEPGTTPPAPRTQLRRLLVVLAGLALGALMAVWVQASRTDAYGIGVVLALPVAILPGARYQVVRLLDRLRNLSLRARRWMAVGIGAGAALLSLAQALRDGRELMPQWHDEHSYLLQAAQMAHGRLWYPEHPVADFFESFHILVKPVYASIYWPGTALMNVPGHWLGLPPWVMPLVLYGVTAALVFLLASRLLDDLAGVMAALVAMTVLDHHGFSTRVLAQTPTALLGAGLLWAWVSWRSAEGGRRWTWVALMGVFAGWLAITRPVDALAFALPVAIAVVVDLVREHRRALRAAAGEAALARGLLRPVALTGALGIACVLPFLGIQLLLNWGTTGSILRPPYVQYLEESQPGTVYGSGGVRRDEAPPQPTTTLPQKRDYYFEFVYPQIVAYHERPAWRDLSQRRVPDVMFASLPGRSFYAWFAVGLLVALGAYGYLPARATPVRAGSEAAPGAPGLRAPLLVMLAIVAGYLWFYRSNPIFLVHYAVPLGVALAPIAIAGLRAAEEAAGARLRPLLVVLLSGGLLMWFAMLAVVPPQGVLDPHEVTFKNHRADQVFREPALVLVRYTPGANHHWEPVYNSDVPWPDEAPIIWAHELGERTGEILRYYAQRQPERRVYLLVRHGPPGIGFTNDGYPLGTVVEALALFESDRWPAARTASGSEARP